jgi:GH15 family glucan-1,4-alpha-glucosidase
MQTQPTIDGRSADRATDAAPGPTRPTLPRSRRRLRRKSPRGSATRSGDAGATAQTDASRTDLPLVDLPLAIEDYALIGDCTTAALVGRNGSIDWLCWPRFDSNACFAALLGTSDHGRWRISPADLTARVTRAYHNGTMVLETVFATGAGRVAVIDFMPLGQGSSSVVRVVEGRAGEVEMYMHLKLRFDYGSSVPWVTRLEDNSGISAIVGPNRVTLRTPVELRGDNLATVANFRVARGQRIPFVMTYGASHLAVPNAMDWQGALADTSERWRTWSGQCRGEGPWRGAVVRSLLTLKALTHEATGGIIAAPTTSLPEQIGGARNWDYRYCWLRDATLTLMALMSAGYSNEARAWRDWLLRAALGSPEQIQIMYGVAGERQLNEWEVPWLPGYQGSTPVRIGNAASCQVQLDIYGELLDGLSQARGDILAPAQSGWDLQAKLVEHLLQIWDQPDDGIWEVRGGARHFTYSKVMAWVALDRTVRDAERFQLRAPLDHWRRCRDEMHATICAQGFNRSLNTFTQSFGSSDLDASLLRLPIVGFLPADDPRMRATVAAIERELVADGFVLRYRTKTDIDGLPPGEGAFLPCSFWLADAYILQGRNAEAHALFERLISLCNDVGLLAEEYDLHGRRQVGNFPQAFSHLALIGTALSLHKAGPVQRRARGAKPR